MIGDGQNTDPQSIDYPNGLPKWTTLKWTTPKNNILNEYRYYLMFLAASILKLYICNFRLCSSCTCGPLENRHNADVNNGKTSIVYSTTQLNL